jgi:hypothetical protein
MIIDWVDQETVDRLVWAGIAEAVVDVDTTSEIVEPVIETPIEEVLEETPEVDWVDQETVEAPIKEAIEPIVEEVQTKKGGKAS